MIHISPRSCTKALFNSSKKILDENQFLMLCGPLFRNDKVTSKSNFNFDQLLKLRNPLWGIGHLEKFNEIAFENGFTQDQIIEMPSNNLSVIYKSS